MTRDRLTHSGDWHGLGLIPAEGMTAIFVWENGPNIPGDLTMWREPVVGWMLVERQYGGPDIDGRPTGYGITYGTLVYGVSLQWAEEVPRPAADEATPCEERHGAHLGCHLGYLPSATALDVGGWERLARRHLDVCHRLKAERNPS